MKRLIEFLIYRMETLDGQRGSATPLLKKMMEKHEEDYKKSKSGTKFMPSLLKQYKSYMSQLMILKQVSVKYTILNVRQKISFSAAKQGMTIYEVLLKSIDKTFQALLEERSIIVPEAQQEREDELHSALTKGNGMAIKAIMYDLIKHKQSIAAQFNQ